MKYPDIHVHYQNVRHDIKEDVRGLRYHCAWKLIYFTSLWSFFLFEINLKVCKKDYGTKWCWNSTVNLVVYMIDIFFTHLLAVLENSNISKNIWIPMRVWKNIQITRTDFATEVNKFLKAVRQYIWLTREVSKNIR